MQGDSRRQRGLIVAAAVASLTASLLLITAVFLQMEYREAHDHAEQMEQLCSTTAAPQSTAPTQQAPCTSAGCVRAAARILDYMDPSVDPCQDFYQFSCGRFHLNQPRPTEEATWNHFLMVSRHHQTVMSEDLMSREPEDLAGAAGKVRQAFQQCTNMTSRDQAGVSRLSAALERIGGWPALSSLTGTQWNNTSYRWSTAAMLAQRYTGRLTGAPLIYLSVSIDEKNATRHLLHVDQPSLGMTRGILVEPESNPELHSAYERLITDTLILLLPRDGEGQSTVNETVRAAAQEAAAQIRQFEVQLARLTIPAENRRNSSRIYNKMTLNELQQLTDQIQPNMVLFGEFKLPNARARKDRAWADVRQKAIDIGLITADKSLTQFKKNYIFSTINVTKEKMRASRQTGNGGTGAPILSELDNAVLDVIGRDSDEALVTVPGGRPGEGGTAAESDEDEEPPPKKRSAGPGTSQPRGAPGPSRPVRQQEPDRPRPVEQEPDRDALQARYYNIMSMPDSRRTVAERAEVRQILTVQLLERMLAGHIDEANVVFL